MHHTYLIYVIIGLFAYLIINGGFNFVIRVNEMREGISDAAATKSGKTNANNAAASVSSKCPADCTSVKELQQKLSDATKKVATLEEDIVANTNASVQHSLAITNLTQSVNDMQKKQEDN